MSDSLALSGTAVFQEQIALPPDAVLTVTLEDVSRADAPAVILGKKQFGVGGQQSPIVFSLVYPRSAVTPTARYTARARVTLGDQLLYTTTEHNPVDASNPSPVELMMTSVPLMQAPPTPAVSLTETYWKFVECDGQPVVVAEQTREPSLVLRSQDSRFSGSGGVNRFMGGYTLDGDALTFSAAGATMMAGPPEAMKQEQAILAALGRVRGFLIAGDRLTLLDDTGRPALRAVAVALG